MVGLSVNLPYLSNQEAKYPDIVVDECEESISGKVKVSIEDEELCSRYAARLLVNVKVGKSPYGCSSACASPAFVRSTTSSM